MDRASELWDTLLRPLPARENYADKLMPLARNPAMPADWAQSTVMGMANTLGNIVAMPKRAMERGITTEDAIPWGGETALTLAGMGAPAAARGAAGIFGGRLAATADKAALARAEEMAASGTPREKIWGDTGWFQGADGKWRFEIPDNAAALTGDRFRNQTLRQEMQHHKAYDAYPDTADIGMLYGARPNSGSYWRSTIEGTPKPHESMSVSDVAKDPSVHLHELQHAVQAREGFAPGGNPNDFIRAYKSQLRDLEESVSTINGRLKAASGTPKYDELMALRQELVNEIRKIEGPHGIGAREKGFDEYRRLPGEVEARNVQSRMNMTPEERRAKPPWLTEDVPLEQQIFR